MSPVRCTPHSGRTISKLQCAFSTVVHLSQKPLVETFSITRLTRQVPLPLHNRHASLRSCAAHIHSRTPSQTKKSENSLSSNTNESSVPVEVFGFSDSAFVDAVSGEWFGYEVTFSGKTGAALPVEDRFVPDAYREWGVTVTGFDTVSSTTVNAQGALHIRRTRAMPTVGCEADAIAGDVYETVVSSCIPDLTAEGPINDDGSTSKCNGGFADGSFSYGPEFLREDDLSQRWGCAITHPHDNQRRVRLSFGRLDEKVSSISVLMETWDSIYNAGAILPGCGGPHSSFGDDPRTSPDSAAGSWSVRATVYTASDQWSKRSYSKTLERGPVEALALPRGLAVRVARENGGMTVEAAWLVDPSTRSVVRRFYGSDRKLSFVEHAVEIASQNV